MPFLSVKSLSKNLDDYFVEFLSGQGLLKRQQTLYSVWKGPIYYEFFCGVIRRGGGNIIRPHGRMGFKFPGEIYRSFISQTSDKTSELLSATDLTISYAYYKRNNAARIQCDQLHDLEGAKIELSEFYSNCVSPCFKTYSDPRSLTMLYVDKNDFMTLDHSLLSWNGYITATKGLILSRLYAPEYYELLKERYEPVFSNEPLKQETLDNIARLIDYLDQEKRPELGV
ncbi:MAG: hypothetical protein MK096_02475 [Oleiphilaceae bacterium]|nr:hypothetical protein [Oleiphilaceae bacterium]